MSVLLITRWFFAHNNSSSRRRKNDSWRVICISASDTFSPWTTLLRMEYSFLTWLNRSLRCSPRASNNVAEYREMRKTSSLLTPYNDSIPPHIREIALRGSLEYLQSIDASNAIRKESLLYANSLKISKLASIHFASASNISEWSLASVGRDKTVRP